jgi:hypothetical protein
MQASLVLTLLFARALLGSLLVKFWLTTRQVRHVAAHRDAVPDAFRRPSRWPLTSAPPTTRWRRRDSACSGRRSARSC